MQVLFVKGLEPNIASQAAIGYQSNIVVILEYSTSIFISLSVLHRYCLKIRNSIYSFQVSGQNCHKNILNLDVDAHTSNLVNRTFSFTVLKYKNLTIFSKMCFFLLKLPEYCANIAPKSEIVNTLFTYQDKIAAILFSTWESMLIVKN